MKIIPYDRISAINYAKIWALSRNPAYYDFSRIGGDCTNFASQCLFAGSKRMNFTPILGWFYRNAYDRTASWTGVPFFYNFLMKNKGLGPYGKTVSINQLQLGDFIQLKNNTEYHHTLIVIDFNDNTPMVASHSIDALNKDLTHYSYHELRCIHIEGVRI